MLDIVSLTPEFAIGPQVSTKDFEPLRAAGFASVLNARPDDELGTYLTALEAQQLARTTAWPMPTVQPKTTPFSNPISLTGLSRRLQSCQSQSLRTARQVPERQSCGRLLHHVTAPLKMSLPRYGRPVRNLSFWRTNSETPPTRPANHPCA